MQCNSRVIIIAVGLVLCLAGLFLNEPGYTKTLIPSTDPGATGPCTVASQRVNLTVDVEADIYYPSGAACPNWVSQPYPGIAFAHGFSMFGLSNGMTDNAGNGEHLASWGYVVAVPLLPDGFEERLTLLRSALDYLSAQTGVPGSILSGKVDTQRLATVGHSLGGATALAAAARDSRVKAVVALDPVYHGGAPGQETEVWNPIPEAPNIHVPVGILGAPGSSCNAQADYADLYPLLGSSHRASYLVNGASHCDFTDPGSSFCSLVCGSTNATRTILSERYMTAWLNYYLHVQANYYDTIFGAQLTQDQNAGLISPQYNTQTDDLSGLSLNSQVWLGWEVFDHPVIGGYNVYRREAGESFPTTPNAHLGVTGYYLDVGVTPGETYTYTVRSYDLDGNLHQAAEEVGVTVSEDPGYRVCLPLVRR